METNKEQPHTALPQKIQAAAKTVIDQNIDPRFAAVINYLKARKRIADRLVISSDLDEQRVLTGIFLSHNESIKEILGL